MIITSQLESTANIKYNIIEYNIRQRNKNTTLYNRIELNIIVLQKDRSKYTRNQL